MKKYFDTRWLKIPAVLGILLMALPPINLLYSGITDSFTTEKALFSMGVLLFCMLFGMLASWIVNPLPMIVGRIILIILSVGAGILSGWVLQLHAGAFFISLLGIPAAFIFLLGGYYSRISYKDILHEGIFQAFIIEIIVSAVLMWILVALGWASEYDISFLIFTLLVELGCYCIVRNQANIDNMMERRRNTIDEMPKHIRSYNLLLSVGAFILLLACFLLRGVFLSGIQLVLSAFRGIIMGIWLLWSWLFSLRPEDESAEIEKAQQESFMFDTAAGGSDLLNSILVFIGLAAAVILIIVFRRQIFGGLREVMVRISALLRKILFHSGDPVEQGEGGSPYYRDFVEEISHTQTRSTASGLRTWRKKLREFQQMPGGAEKLRFGYGLTLEWLRMHDSREQIVPSKTVREIEEAARSLVPNERYSLLCTVYERVRYGDDNPDPDETALLEQILTEMSAAKHA